MQVKTRGLPDGKGTGREGQSGVKEESWFFGLRTWAVGIVTHLIQSGTQGNSQASNMATALQPLIRSQHMLSTRPVF